MYNNRNRHQSIVILAGVGVLVDGSSYICSCNQDKFCQWEKNKLISHRHDLQFWSLSHIISILFSSDLYVCSSPLKIMTGRKRAKNHLLSRSFLHLSNSKSVPTFISLNFVVLVIEDFGSTWNIYGEVDWRCLFPRN